MQTSGQLWLFLSAWQMWFLFWDPDGEGGRHTVKNSWSQISKQSIWTGTKDESLLLLMSWLSSNADDERGSRCSNVVSLFFPVESQTKYLFDKLAKITGHKCLWLGHPAETRSALPLRGLVPNTQPPAPSHGEDTGTQEHKPFLWNCKNKNINEATTHLQFETPSNSFFALQISTRSRHTTGAKMIQTAF